MPALTVFREGEELPSTWEQCLFLAGSGPAGWQDAAVAELQQQGYTGVVLIPDGHEAPSQNAHSWNKRWLPGADVILYWFEPDGPPPGVEFARFGERSYSGRVVLGVPPTLPGAEQLHRWAGTRRVPVAETMDGAVRLALGLMAQGRRRVGVERSVPLPLWSDPTFQRWLATQRAAGNELREMVRIWTFRRGRGWRDPVLFIALPRLWVEAEQRVEFGEIVVFRPDQAATLVYWPEHDPGDTKILLVRDVRAAASTSDGYVWELPGGSGGSIDLEQVSTWEIQEETGLEFPIDRLRDHGSRQLVGALSAHVLRLFSVKGTPEELRFAQSQHNVVHGLHREGEFTWPTVVTVREMLSLPVDWATVGMILAALAEIAQDESTGAAG